MDSETAESLERILSQQVLDGYRRRFDQHQRLVQTAAHRSRAIFITASVAQGVEALARGPLAPLMEAA